MYLQASCTKTLLIPLEQKEQSWFVTVLQCNYCNQVHLDKVDQLYCTKITKHSEKVGCQS